MDVITARNVDHKHGAVHGRPHVTMLENEEISTLAPYSALILTVSLIVFFLVRYYVFEGFLLARVYGDTYTRLNDNQRRGFTNHHVAATAKIIMVSIAAYPFFAIIAGNASLQTTFVKSGVVTFGDVLLVLNQVFAAMYIFELIFRAKLSYVAVAHHVGSVLMAAATIAISVDWKHQPDATLEFILCCLWGMFDVIAEFWPHVAIIFYRIYPKDHNLLRIVFFVAALITLVGTIVETIVVMYFWGWAWDRWTLAFRIVTPILHVIFTAAQLWGAKNFYQMWQDQKALMRKRRADAERGTSHIPETHQD